MCNSCGCETKGMRIQYQCDCKNEDCVCGSIIEFEREPKASPYCCGVPMKRIK
ncbi:MAG: hypothetical protein QXS02_00830 [Candidatus Thermoplasmatota archaeon]